MSDRQTDGVITFFRKDGTIDPLDSRPAVNRSCRPGDLQLVNFRVRSEVVHVSDLEELDLLDVFFRRPGGLAAAKDVVPSDRLGGF
jgi:hypothetical protein